VKEASREDLSALRGAVELGFVVIGGKKIGTPDAKKRGRKVKT